MLSLGYYYACTHNAFLSIYSGPVVTTREPLKPPGPDVDGGDGDGDEEDEEDREGGPLEEDREGGPLEEEDREGGPLEDTVEDEDSPGDVDTVVDTVVPPDSGVVPGSALQSIVAGVVMVIPVVRLPVSTPERLLPESVKEDPPVLAEDALPPGAENPLPPPLEPEDSPPPPPLPPPSPPSLPPPLSEPEDSPPPVLAGSKEPPEPPEPPEPVSNDSALPRPPFEDDPDSDDSGKPVLIRVAPPTEAPFNSPGIMSSSVVPFDVVGSTRLPSIVPFDAPDSLSS